MDSATLSTFAGLAGAVIGGATSLATTWLTTATQARNARLAAERAARQDLYGRYMDELAALYAAALRAESVNFDRAASAFALRGRIGLMGSGPVVEAAEKALKFVVDLSMGPKRDEAEVRAMMDSDEANIIDAFAATCREEIQAIA
jgi:hypothetical protein